MPKAREKYPRPRIVFVSSGKKEQDKLLKIEEQLAELIKQHAEQYGKLLEFDKSQFWSHALPHTLLQILESFEPESALRAAEAFCLHCKVRDLQFDVERDNLLADAFHLLSRRREIDAATFKDKPPLAVEEWQAQLAAYEKQYSEG